MDQTLTMVNNHQFYIGHSTGGLVFLVASLVFLMAGCKVHHTLPLNRHTVEIPQDYLHGKEEGSATVGEWWKAFNVPELNEVMDQALSGNLTLKQSWWRVAQACWQAKVVGSQKIPEITTMPSVGHFRSSSSGISNTGNSLVVGKDHFTQYLLLNSLNYEVDLWKRIDSQVKAACFEMQATREELDATAWTLAGTVADLWFSIQEQQTLLDVIDHQIKVSRTQLELIELRYSVAQSSALAVYQQRLQLAQIEQLRTPVETQLSTLQNQMAVILGIPPEDTGYVVENGIVPLPPFPEIGSPGELLCNRPDLRAQLRLLQSADYQVAAAVADRFPRLNLSIGYDLQSLNYRHLFEDQISHIVGSLILPVIDGGRRRAEVQRRNAIVCELLNQYGQLFLDALLEVEDALIQEKQQIKFLEQLKNELEIAKINLEESNWHYINGLNDYLSVIAAIQALQNLERRIVLEKKTVINYPCKALSFSWRTLSHPMEYVVLTFIKKSWKQVFWIGVILSVSLVLAMISVMMKSKTQKTQPNVKAKLVHTIIAKLSDEKIMVTAFGTVQPNQEVTIKSEVSGRVIEKSPKLVKGGIVSEGEVLLKLDPRDYQNAVEQEKANLEKAVFEMQIEEGRQLVAEREWKQLSPSIKITDISEILALRKPHIKEKEAALKAAKSRLHTAQLNLSRTVIQAPLNAVVTSKSIEVGDYVTPQEKLAKLVATNRFQIQVSVPVSKLKWLTIPGKEIKKGSKVRVIQNLGVTSIVRKGEILRLLGDLDPGSRMARVIVAVEDPLGLHKKEPFPLFIGSYVRVIFEGLVLNDLFVLPREALQEENKVWVKNSQNQLEIRTVNVLEKKHDSVLINHGLNNGEEIIVSPLSIPIPGMHLETFDAFEAGHE